MKKKILFISSQYNYFVTKSSSFHRMYNNLVGLQKTKEFDVVVLQPHYEKHIEDQNLKKDIKCYYFREIAFFKNRFSYFIDFNPFFIVKVIKIIKKERIDLIHLDFVYGGLSLRIFTRIPVSYNSHNVEVLYHKKIGKYYHKIPIFLRAFYWRYIHYLEKILVKHAININAISSVDKDLFIKIYDLPEEKLLVNSIGYNKKVFNKMITKEVARSYLGIEKNKFVVIFHGYLTMEANIEAVRIIREKIAPKSQDKDILFLLAGKNVNFKNKDNIKFLGYVENLNYFLYAADIAIVPVLRGSGVRTKIIDYLSARIPVITTKTGAEGLPIIHKEHCFIINSRKFVEEFIDKIEFLKNHPEEIEKIKNNIESLLEKEFNWEKIIENLATKYKKLF
ncbi:MAG: glycosyltransferase family 4 protein [Promethearchaeota archaeon]